MTVKQLPLNNAPWHKFLPRLIRSRIDGRHGLQAVLANSGWLFGDRILRMFMSLLVGVWTVRYLGPVQLGLLNYAGAFAGLFAMFATLGLDSLVVRDLVKEPERQDTLLGTAFGLRLVAGVFACVAAIAAITLLRPGETLTAYLVAIAASMYLLMPLYAIDFFFQAKVLSKYTVYATTSAFLFASGVKIALLLTNAPLIAFALSGLLEFALSAIFLVLVFRYQGHSVFRWRFDLSLARTLLFQCWPLLLSGLAISIYMRIDQVMIGQMLGDREVGLFSAAIRVSELWYFVPIALASSVFPTIVASKKLGDEVYYARLQQFFTVMTWIALSVAIFATVFRDAIVQLLYGTAYAESATVLGIHIWAGVFVASGVASSGWFVVENLQKVAFYRSLAGGVINVVLNLLWIPRFGIEGSAMATVLSQALASTFFDVLSTKTRRVFWMKLKAFILIHRLFYRMTST